MTYPTYHLHDSDPGEAVPKSVYDMQFYTRQDFEKFDRDIFRQITPEMRRKYAGYILCAGVETRKVLFFKKTSDEPWGDEYIGVPIVCYRMPPHGSSADPTLVN